VVRPDLGQLELVGDDDESGPPGSSVSCGRRTAWRSGRVSATVSGLTVISTTG
jgi:hypothetical protein